MPDTNVVGFNGTLTVNGEEVAVIKDVVLRFHPAAFHINALCGYNARMERDEMTVVLSCDWFINPDRLRYERWRDAWETSI